MRPAAPSAQLRLRSGDGPLGAQLVWPPATPTGVLILLVDAREVGAPVNGEYICRSISDTLGVISLSAACAGLQDGATAIEWTADHAAQLGAHDARGVMLAGLHTAAAVVASLAIRARDTGWPDVARQVLIHPRLAAATPSLLAGVAPATVVGGDAGSRAYTAHLRRSGVPVDQFDHPDPFRAPRPQRGSADRLLRLLAPRLR